MDGEKKKAKLRRRIRMLEREERKKHKRLLNAVVGKSGMWPLNAPGMPPPGPDFLRVAQGLGDQTEYAKQTKTREGVYKPGDKLEELYRRALREVGFSIDVKIREGTYGPVTFVPGHIWGQYSEEWQRSILEPNYEPPKIDGPHPAEVFVLGKMPWREETIEGRNLIGATGEILIDLIAKLRVRGAQKWYVSNLVKFMPPDDTSVLKAGWIHDCMPLLHQELRIVRPKYILCLGADASKWLLGDKFNVSYMAGRVVPYTYPIHLTYDHEPEHHTAHVMTVLHPAEVSREPAKARILESNFRRFAYLIEGHNLDIEEQGLDHRVCNTLEDAEEWVQEVNAYFADKPKRLRLVGIDAEWQGQHPINKGSYVRTIQIAWDEKKSMCFVISHPGGKCAFRDRDGKPAVKRLVRLLNEFMEDKRACGHFFVSDLEWLHHLGFDPIKHCPVPLYPNKKGKLAWERLRNGEGWLDSAYMNHAVEETAPLGLEMLTMRYTSAPRYDIALEDAVKEYCKKQGIKREALEGYGDIPDKVLVPYANYDADVTLRIVKNLLELLDSDYEGNCAWEPFWESMIIQKPILRIHKNGICVDRGRVDDLTKKFVTARYAQEEKIQTWARWTETEECAAFNVRSNQQVREFLFGEKYNGKRDERGKPIRLRPEGARCLNLEPLLDTSKPPRRWKDLKERGLDRDATPGTGKMILGIMAQENLNVADQINMVRDYRFLDQVLKSILRHPKVDEDDHWIENEDGFLEYEAGLAACIDNDGRVRTHIYPTAETGRWKHSRPNLANISKSRDPDYVRMLGGEKVNGKWVGGLYTHKLRSVLKAAPGYCLIEFDYKGAELYGMSLMAGSKKMMEHCERANTYEEEGYSRKGKKAKPDHKCKDGKKGCELCGYPSPEYYDIHSNVAKLAFQLECHPSKFGLDQIGKSHFRTLAKNVIFGIAYGRGAKAIALQAKEQGVNVTVEQAQMVIDAIFEMYPELVPFFDEAKQRALNEKWLCHCFGRYRRFPTTSDYKMEGEFERQAMNFPIQGMIASAVDRGLAFLDDKIDELGLQDDIRLLLQMHDAGLVECKYELVPYAKKLINWAMVDMVEIWPTDLAGEMRGDGPYHLGLDFAVEQHWGEKIPKDKYAELGIPV